MRRGERAGFVAPAGPRAAGGFRSACGPGAEPAAARITAWPSGDPPNPMPGAALPSRRSRGASGAPRLLHSLFRTARSARPSGGEPHVRT